MSGQRIKLRDRLNFIAEELDSDAFFVCGTGIHFDDVAAHAKSAARKIHIVALVQHFDQTAQHRFARYVLTLFYSEEHL